MTRLYVLALCTLILTGIGACSDQSVVSSLTSEDLLSATLSAPEIRQILPSTETWWPNMPEFNGGLDPFPGERFYIVQSYTQVDGTREAWIDTALTLCEDESTARKLYAERVRFDSKGCMRLNGPSVGDQSAYFAGRDSDNYYGVTLRYRVGEIVGRVSLFAKTGYEKPENLARIAELMMPKIKAVLSGKLKAEPMPTRIAACLPSPPASNAIGLVNGTAYIPAEGWALVDTAGNPPRVLGKLHKGGVNQLAIRRYRVKDDADFVIDITLFKFSNRASAESWAQEWADEVKRIDKPLDAGKTGDHSAYGVGNGGRFYEMTFAKGTFVCDACGHAPFGDAKPSFETPVRQLAEMWYELIPEK